MKKYTYLYPVLTIFFVCLISCSNTEEHKVSVTPPVNRLESLVTSFFTTAHISFLKYDTVYIMSSYGCGGCLADKVYHHMGPKDLVIMDTTLGSEVFDLLVEKNYLAISIDTIFEKLGKFSNALKVYRSPSDSSIIVENIKNNY